jgi:hypothetical protein
VVRGDFESIYQTAQFSEHAGACVVFTCDRAQGLIIFHAKDRSWQGQTISSPCELPKSREPLTSAMKATEKKLLSMAGISQREPGVRVGSATTGRRRTGLENHKWHCIRGVQA